ncbi:MAG: methyl-accepting chemotaxis protein [Nitrospirota bacterium]|nr:methyl-accepting chemotaxis protein [Nitrospirota bacterium]
MSERQLILSSEKSLTNAPASRSDSGYASGHDPVGSPVAPVPWHKKVTTRFFLWLFLALSLGFSVLGWQIDRMEQKRAVHEVSTRLDAESDLLMESLLHLLEKGDLPGAQSLFSSIHSRIGDRAVLIGPDGTHVLIPSGSALPEILSTLSEKLSPQDSHRRFLRARTRSGESVFLDRTALFSDAACQECKGTRKLLGTLVVYTSGNAFDRTLRSDRWALFWMFSGILETLVLFIILLIRRSLVRPLDGLVYAIARVGPENPDLRLSFPRIKNDEIGRLVYFLNRFVDLFRGWMGEVSDRVKWVEAHADLLNRDHEKRYRKEEEVRMTLGELRLRVRDLLTGSPGSAGGEMARNLSHFSEKSKKIQQVTQSVHASVKEARTVSSDLGVQGESLTKMRRNLSVALATIAEISKEMHLTGLNAAIEAAHAGEHGKTFRIVADTVAGLSKKTEGAVNLIGSELSDLSRQLDRVVSTLSSESEELETADRRLVRFQDSWKGFQESLARLEIQWDSVAERIRSDTESILKIQDILDSLSEDFREQLVQKPLEERHLGEIMKVVKELNREIERFRV